MRLDTIYNEDCLVAMRRIPDSSVDMILCDLPYSVTTCKWDQLIPFEPLWAQYNRVAKKNAAIVLTASQPFTTDLICSNKRGFRYCWYWYKNLVSGIGIARFQPMRVMEEVLIFYRAAPTFNRQECKSRIADRHIVPGARNGNVAGYNSKSNHFPAFISVGNVIKDRVNPRNVLEFACVPNASGKLHPTQKPVALFEYLIRTYTTEGETCLDNCIGSGTTAIACINTNRHYIGFEKDARYFQIAQDRIKAHAAQQMLTA